MVEKTRQRRFGNLRAEARLANSRLGSLRYDVGIPPCQQKNCCALTALDGNGGGKPRALPWAVMWRPFRPCIRTAILEKGGHGFTIDGTAQGLRYGRLGSLRHKGLPWFCRFHCEISGLMAKAWTMQGGPSCRAASPAERSGAHGGKRSPQANRAPHPFHPAGRRTVRASGPCHPGLQTLDNAGL